ncbi:MAG: hypothetical protein VCA74_04055 [Deltaproteobacteria bacterium]
MNWEAKLPAFAATAAALVFVSLTPTGAAAVGSELEAFISRTVRMGTYNRTVRADIKLSRSDGSHDQAILVVAPQAGRQFFALRSSGWRSLLPLDWNDGKAVRKKGKKPVAISIDDPLGGTDLRAMELFPFWAFEQGPAFVSDETSSEKTVTLYVPDGLPYTIFVISFDKARMVPLSVKYYKDTMNNMVRIRENSDFVMVGSRLRPRNILIRDYTQNTTTTLKLDWSVLEEAPPGLLAQGSFDRTAIAWPPAD